MLKNFKKIVKNKNNKQREDKNQMSQIKLIALDMDGTLFNNQGEISEKDRETLKRATEAGVAVAVATGRAYTELPIEMLYDIGVRYAVTGNGSGVYRLPDKECVFSDCLDNEVVYEILEELNKLDVYYDIYVEGLVYCPKSVCHNIRKMDMTEALYEHIERTRIIVDDAAGFLKECGKKAEKVTINFALQEDGSYLDREAAAKILDCYPQVQYLCGGYHNWEFTRAGVTKGSGLHFLAQKIGVDMKETMACGDSENDLYMLKEAHVAVAMGNATKQIKEIADFVTLTNEESGVSYAVEKLVLAEN